MRTPSCNSVPYKTENRAFLPIFLTCGALVVRCNDVRLQLKFAAALGERPKLKRGSCGAHSCLSHKQIMRRGCKERVGPMANLPTEKD
jgi:hypothetical protein